MSPAAISALSALAGSAIGGLATFALTWLTQYHQAHIERAQQESKRREQLYGEFIELAAKSYIEALSNEFEAEKLVPLYALISRMRLFAPRATVASADLVMMTIIVTRNVIPPGLRCACKPCTNKAAFAEWIRLWLERAAQLEGSYERR